ncbi:hypothetical protein HOLleu_27098 [Holothuria leucospilota]|uniref:Uncharacterized protein n=1 Tax=Holothuria leucospilota TaxID=206669 RepID=A0A9Q1H2Z4_HOLLE|nr:hypothetical protein HOLleu_27098 [Holothuria leucospilota]
MARNCDQPPRQGNSHKRAQSTIDVDIVDSRDVQNGEATGREAPGESVRQTQSVTQASVNTLIGVQTVEGDEVGVPEALEGLIARSPTATLEIGGTSVGCILDTGAETSLIPSSLYRSMPTGILGDPKQLGCHLKVRGANGLDIPFEGYVELPIKAMGHEFMGSFLIQPDASCQSSKREEFPVLLGCNILRKLRGVVPSPLNLDKDNWEMVLQCLPEINRVSVEGAVEKFEVFTGNKVKELQPGESKLLTGFVKSEGKPNEPSPLGDKSRIKGLLYVESACEPCGYGIRDGVVDMKSEVEVLVENLKEEFTIIPPYTKLADSSTVSISPEGFAKLSEILFFT